MTIPIDGRGSRDEVRARVEAMVRAARGQDVLDQLACAIVWRWFLDDECDAEQFQTNLLQLRAAYFDHIVEYVTDTIMREAAQRDAEPIVNADRRIDDREDSGDRREESASRTHE